MTGRTGLGGERSAPRRVADDGRPRDGLLLTPGPSNTSDRVREALARGDECPREAAFARVVGEVRRKLLEVLGAGEGWTAALIPGSGTGALEATLTSLVPAGGRVLVLENGAYGRRAARILDIHGIGHEVRSTPWREPLDPRGVGRALAEGGFTHLYLVHHETTSGVLNPLAEVAREAEGAGVRVLVDAMSSFGAEPMGAALPHLDALVASSNKCLQGAPGIGIVLLRKALIEAADPPPRSLALDLRTTLESMEGAGTFPFTPPVQVVWALDAALDELLEETVSGRRHRYDACYRRIVRWADRAGLRPLVDPAFHSRIVTAFLEPGPWFDYGTLHDRLRDRGVTIYPGKLPEPPSFRVGTVGAMTPGDVDGAMRALAAEVERQRGAGA